MISWDGAYVCDRPICLGEEGLDVFEHILGDEYDEFAIGF